MNATTARKELLDTVFDLLSGYLADECPEDEYFEQFDPEIDGLRTQVGDLAEQEAAMLAKAPTKPSQFVVGIEFRSGFEPFAIEFYHVEAIDWSGAKLKAFNLADDSPYSDDRIPDLLRVATDRTGCSENIQ